MEILNVEPIIFAALGTLLVVFSAVLTGMYISSIETKIIKKEGEISDLNRMLDDAQQAITRSYQHFAPVDIKLLILNSTKGDFDSNLEIKKIVREILQGILERYAAATGSGPSQDEWKRWDEIGQRAERGDNSAFSELSNHSASFLLKWTERHKTLGMKRDNNILEVATLRRKSAYSRYISVTLQILGLLMVLLKDFASVGNIILSG